MRLAALFDEGVFETFDDTLGRWPPSAPLLDLTCVALVGPLIEDVGVTVTWDPTMT